MTIPEQPEPVARHVTVMDDEARQVARVYAEALYRAASEEGTAETVVQELEALSGGVFREDPGIEAFFMSPAVAKDRKTELIRKAFEGKASATLAGFLGVLAEHERLGLVRPIVEAFRTLVDRKHQRVAVQVVSAVPLTDQERGRIAEGIREAAGFEAILHESIDPALLGGLVVRVRDWVYDASVRTRLETIKNQLIERSSHAVERGRDRFGSGR